MKLVKTTNAKPRYAVRSGVCRLCGCTDEDCSHCIERTGRPCSWADAEHTICTAHPKAALATQQ